MALSAALIWVWSTEQTLRGDEWGYANRSITQPIGDYLFNPPRGKHLIAIPLLLYKAAFEGLGIGSYAPYRLAHIALLLLCAGLFYALVRRRVGALLAIIPTTVLLFLGSSGEVVAVPLRIPSLISIAAGLAMLLALERRDLKGDVGACVLLVVGLASHSTSFAFAAAAVVLVLSRPAPERWRRSWVFVLPILAYATWWLLEFNGGRSGSLGSLIVRAPGWTGRSLVATLRGIGGLGGTWSYFGHPISRPMQTVVSVALLALFGAFLVARARRSRSISPFALAMVAALLTFWMATNFAPGGGRVPQETRYLYPDAVLFLLLVCDLGQSFKMPHGLTAPAAAAVLVVFIFSLAGNVYKLHGQERFFDAGSDRLRAGLTSMALVGSAVPPQFNLFNVVGEGARPAYINSSVPGERSSPTTSSASGPTPSSTHRLGLATLELSRLLAAYGSPAYSPAKLLSRPQPVRITADNVLLQAAGSALRPAGRPGRSDRPAPRGLVAAGARWTTASRGCIALRPDGSDNAATGTLSPSGRRLVLSASAGPPAIVRAGRFADGAPIAVGSLRGGARAMLDLPATPGVAGNWRVGVESRQRVIACSA